MVYLWGWGGLPRAGGVGEGAASKKKVASTGHGSARWGTLADARAERLLERRGIFLGALDGYYLTESADTHVAVFGESGSGKDMTVVLPTIVMEDGDAESAASSLVITDPKGGLTYAQTETFRRGVSEVQVYAPLDRESADINILDTVHDFRSAQAVVKSLLAPAELIKETPVSLHFRELAEVLLTGGIFHVLDTSQRRSLPGVLDYFTVTHERLEDALEEMMESKHSHPELHQLIVSMAREIQKIKDRELSGVWTTTMRALHLFRDETLARHSDRSTIDLQTLQHGPVPTTLYLVSPTVESLADYHPVYRVVLETIFRYSRARQYRRRLLCVLNEFPAYGFMPLVDKGSATLRESGVRLLLVAQDLEQLWNVYGRGTQIWGNLHTKVFHGAANDETAKRISAMLDQTTVQREVTTYSGRWWARRASVSTQEHGRPLMTAGEVRTLSKQQALLVISGRDPWLIEKVWWDQDPVFRTRIQKVEAP